MASYPQELAQDAAYQSNTSRLTELWSLPRPAQGLNTNNNNNNNSRDLLNLLLITIWSVWFCVILSGETHDTL